MQPSIKESREISTVRKQKIRGNKDNLNSTDNQNDVDKTSIIQKKRGSRNREDERI